MHLQRTILTQHHVAPRAIHHCCLFLTVITRSQIHDVCMPRERAFFVPALEAFRTVHKLAIDAEERRFGIANVATQRRLGEERLRVFVEYLRLH